MDDAGRKRDRMSHAFHVFAHGTGCPGCYPKDKRLTDAELAAEWHDWVAHIKHLQWSELSSESPLLDEQWLPIHARAMTLWRFATLPHYDGERP